MLGALSDDERGTVSVDSSTPAGAGAGPARASDFSYSIVIPVYNSQDVVGTTLDRVLEVFEAAGLRHQVVLVNDGSRDASWDVIAERARRSPHVVALDLLRNYGQHHANLAGMREATGDYVITLDDDLQNPPDQALLLIDKAMEGHDVVFGRFERKQAKGYRRLGSRLISAINRRVFHQPPGLAVSNYRILRRDVVERICASRTAHPYITGQALMFSSDPADVLVKHDARAVGDSHYGLRRIVSLVLTILFSYSVFPLRAAAGLGFAVAAGSFLLGLFYLVRSLFVDSQAPGWTTIAVLLAIMNGFVIMMLSMLGEYVVRTLNAVSAPTSYHVARRVTS
jgi:glycosyltransferase involved in cell wall biosynthesis